MLFHSPGTGIIGTYLCQLIKEKQQEQRISNTQTSYNNLPSSSTTKLHQFTSLSSSLSNNTITLPQYLAIDMNPFACDITIQTAYANHINPMIECIQGDLIYPILSRCLSQIDILIWNPPYVPTPESEVIYQPTVNKCQKIESLPNNNTTNTLNTSSLYSKSLDTDLLTGSWAGGPNGRLVIDRLLPYISKILKPINSIGYFILVEDNLPKEIAQYLHTQGFQTQIIQQTKAKNEQLLVLKFWR